MNKSFLIPGIIALLVVIGFGVDAWLRSQNKVSGPEELVAPTPTKPAKVLPPEEQYSTTLSEAISTEGATLRAARLIAVDDSITVLDIEHKAERHQTVLKKILETCPNEPLASEAAARLMNIACADKNDAAVAANVDELIKITERLGVGDRGVPHDRFFWVIRTLEKDERYIDLVDKIEATLSRADQFGPPEVREVTAFQMGMGLAGERFAPAAKIDRIVKYVRKNTSKQPLTEDFKWINAQQGAWFIEPMEAHLTLKPGEEKTLEFHVKYDREKSDFLPFPTAHSVVKGWMNIDQKARLPMDLKRYYLGRTVSCVRIAKPPAIDGKLDDDAWKQCKPTSKIYCTDGSTPPNQDMQVSVCYDDHGLYLGARLLEEDMDNIFCVEAKRDGKVWEDDCIEFMINTHIEQMNYYQFIVNAKNIQYDGVRLDRTPDFKWTSATDGEEKAWVVECFFPWKEFAVEQAPKPGDKMWCQFVRNRTRGGKRQVTHWAPAFVVDNHKPLLYGAMVFE